MIDDAVVLADGREVSIEETICECNHWCEEHADGDPIEAGCGAPGCDCRGFVYSSENSAPFWVAARGGAPEEWPDYVARSLLLASIRDRVAGDGCPVDSCEANQGDEEIVVEFAGRRYRLGITSEERA